MQMQSASPLHPLTRQIVVIDGLRLAAALLVVGEHLLVSAWLPSRHSGLLVTTDFYALRPYACYGWIGVQIFFVISGFVIAYSAQEVTATTFARHRLLRIYPMALLCGTIILVAMEVGMAGQWPQSRLVSSYLRAVLFLPGELVDDPFWTLPVEMVFYLCVYLMMTFRKLRYLTAVMAVFGSISALYWMAASLNPYWTGTSHDFVLRVLKFFALSNRTLVPHACFFALGVLLWDSLLKRTDAKRLSVITFLIVGGVSEIRFRDLITAQDFGLSMPWWRPVAIWLVALAVITVGTLYNVPIQRTLGRRGVTVLRSLGLLTYPLYLLHYRISVLIAIRLAVWTGFRTALIFATTLVTMLAYFLAIKIDPKMQRILRQRLAPERAQTSNV